MQELKCEVSDISVACLLTAFGRQGATYLLAPVSSRTCKIRQHGAGDKDYGKEQKIYYFSTTENSSQ